MKTLAPLALALAAMLAPCAASAQMYETKTATETTINGSDLADTLSTAAFDMQMPAYWNRLSLIMAITWGTSTSFQVQCKTSADGTNYGWITTCDTASPRNCEPEIYEYAVADGTTLTLDLSVSAPWVICQLDDAADGTGTITARAILARQ